MEGETTVCLPWSRKAEVKSGPCRPGEVEKKDDRDRREMYLEGAVCQGVV